MSALTGAGRDLQAGFAGSSTGCGNCHRVDAEFSHPVNVLPSGMVPEQLPLERGRVTCLTCHAIGTDHVAGRTRGDAWLRDDAAMLCGACHDAREGLADLHAGALGRAHLRWPGREGVARRGLSGGRGSVDGESTGCLSCHDGTLTTSGSHAEMTAFRRDMNGGSHPIGVPYRSARLDGLRPIGGLDERIRLFDGQLGCGSCHNPYARSPNRLAMSNHASALCLECHRF